MSGIASNPRHAQLSPSSAVLAVCDSYICASVPGHEVQVFSTATSASEPPLLLKPAAVRCACFDATGLRLIAGGADKQVWLWNLPDVGRLARCWTHGKKVGCVAFSPNGAMALWADAFGEVHGVSLSDADASPTLLLGHLSPISHLRFAPVGNALLTADREGHVRSSNWPNPFVIEAFYLQHVSPLEIVLPLAHVPLLLTVAAAGRELCCWHLHTAKLAAQLTAASLLGADLPITAALQDAAGAPSEHIEGAAADGEDAPGTVIVCAAEVAPQGLLALGYRGNAAVHFAAAVLSASDGTAATIEPRPQLQLALAEAPVAIGYSTGGARLCALVMAAAAVLVFPPKADGLGFDPERAWTVALPFAAPERAIAPPPLCSDAKPGTEATPGAQPEPSAKEAPPGSGVRAVGSAAPATKPAAKRPRDQ